MNSRQRSFYWKIGYVAGLCLLVWPLYWLGHPAVVGTATRPRSSGGVLAELRQQHGLSEADLGAIDPASETMKLVTLGMRGVAANLLWEKANNYKMKKDWTRLSATLEQLARFEPHFISVWQFQAWNLSYNVSVEFDDYRDRYRWVIKGIDFLMQGIDYNEREPRLYWDEGWFTSWKIGRADERVQFRRLFSKDEDFHASLPVELQDPTGKRDNWLCGKQGFLKAEELDAAGFTMKGMTPLVFHSDAPMCQMHFASALETDGIFGEVAQQAWEQAAREWHHFGTLDIPTSFRDPTTGEKLTIHLNDREGYLDEARRRSEELDALAPGVRSQMEKERREALTDKQREALATPEASRTPTQRELAYTAAEKIKVTNEEVAQRVRGADYRKAMKLADEAKKAEQMAGYINNYRQIVNFETWRLRCEYEQTPLALATRKAIFEADTAKEDYADMLAAREAYEKGLAGWRRLLDRFPALKEDDITGSDLVEVIRRYRVLLGRMDEQLPQPFILQDVLDKHGSRPQ